MNEKIKRLYKNIIKNREKYNLGFWLFLLLTGIFPFIIEKFNLSTFRYYRAYYATVITLSFAIYSFIQQQKKALEEKKKELELREKELEAEKDYYRPMFVIESMENSKKQVKLLMKRNDLYLEKTSVYAFNQTFIYKVRNQQFKSGDIISQDVGSTFFIIGETLKGELILFGYLLDGIKIYKYYKGERLYDRTIFRYKSDSLDYYNKVWGTYNITATNEYDSEELNSLFLDNVLFYSTYILRKSHSYKKNLYFYDVLTSHDTFSLASTLIGQLYKEISLHIDNDDCIYEMIKLSIEILYLNKESLYIEKYFLSNKSLLSDFEISLDEHLPKNLTSEIISFNLDVNQNKEFNISKFLEIMLEYLETIKAKSTQIQPFYQITGILDDALSGMECENPVNSNLFKYKEKILYLICKMDFK